MNATSTAAVVQPVRNPYFHAGERRESPRHACSLEATSHPMENSDALSFGAVVHDISANGVGITLCYPFRPGTYLDVELQVPRCMLRSLMVRVVHVEDLRDGMWRLGCEFVKPLTQSDMDLLI
jgi:hypothetical protein